MATKEQLVSAVVKFIENDLLPNIGDRNTKFVLAMAKDALKDNPDLADGFLRSPLVSAMVAGDDSEYDVKRLASVLKSVLSEYQSFPVTVPKIPLFSPQEKVLKITAEDIDSLMRYLSEKEEIQQ